MGQTVSTDFASVTHGARGSDPMAHWSASRGELVEDARPAARALAERGQIVLLVGRMDAIVVEAEADEQAVHAECVLEGGDDRDRSAHADQRRGASPLLL